MKLFNFKKAEKIEVATFHFISSSNFTVMYGCTLLEPCTVLCGKVFNKGEKITGSNFPHVVNCPDCLKVYEENLSKLPRQRLCSFCNTPLSWEDLRDNNAFFLSCFQHKELAQMRTEKFFRENPDYTKWQKP